MIPYWNMDRQRPKAAGACAPEESIWHEPSEITQKRVVESIKMADRYLKEKGLSLG